VIKTDGSLLKNWLLFLRMMVQAIVLVLSKLSKS